MNDAPAAEIVAQHRFRFERDPVEHTQVMLSAGRRFVEADSSVSSGYAWFAIFIGAVLLYFPMAAYRRYVLLPRFDVPEALKTIDLLIIALFPFVLIYVLFLIYGRIVSGIQLRRMHGRLRPKLAVTVTLAPAGVAMQTADMTLTLGWAEIDAVIDTGERIEFETESFVAYLPDRCFRDAAEKQAVYTMAEAFRAGAARAEP